MAKWSTFEPFSKLAKTPYNATDCGVIQPRLDRKICLLKRTTQQDTDGFTYEVWADQFELWVGRERVTANEQAAALQTRGVQVERFRLRYLSCLEDESTLGDYRVRFNGRVYNVISCVEDLRHERRQWMLLSAGFIEGQPTLATADVPAAI